MYLSNFIFLHQMTRFYGEMALRGYGGRINNDKGLGPKQERKHTPADQYHEELQSKHQCKEFYS